MKYSVLIYYDPVDKIYIASIPELEGCIAHGATQEAALQEIKAACDLWIETAQEQGAPIPEPTLHKVAM